MEDKEKILRWDLLEAQKDLDSDVGECPLVSMKFAIMEQRRKRIKKCQEELNDYLKQKNLSI